MGIPFAYITCECGKMGFYSRKSAKRHARRQSLHGLDVYLCPRSETDLWHLGHLPKPVKDGRWSRSMLGASAPRHRKPDPGRHRAD